MAYLNFGWKMDYNDEDISDFPQPNTRNNRQHHEIATSLSPWFFQVQQM
jgi:hypothetical protein